jgi:manganese/zinc/iron transport system permease protein
MNWLAELAANSTLRTVGIGAAMLGIVSGALGSYAVLRRQSLLGDAISHAALPGIAIAFLLTGSRAPLVLVLGAAFAGWIGTLVVLAVVNTTRVNSDSALGVVLSVFFGFGLVLLTFIQRMPDSAQAGLDRFLFGQAASMLRRDLYVIAGLGGAALVAMLLFWKEFKLLSFDPDFGATIGMPMRAFDIVLTSLLVIAIVIGLQTVGVVLMSAMIVAPAAAARQWTDRLGVMVLLSAAFGAAAGVAGALLSSSIARLPTGPTIVLCVTAIVIVSLLFAPVRGIFWSWLRHRRSRREFESEAVLLDMYELASQHARLEHGHSARVLSAMSGGRTAINATLTELQRRGYVRRLNGDWALTPAGIQHAQELRASLTIDQTTGRYVFGELGKGAAQ